LLYADGTGKGRGSRKGEGKLAFLIKGGGGKLSIANYQTDFCTLVFGPVAGGPGFELAA
jgi:hypothetical protein